jgi:zinc transport system permease protein
MAEDTSLPAFFGAWELFREAALSGAAAGALLGWLGVYVVLRRMVFLSAALSQAAGFGVTLAFFAQVYGGVPAGVASPTLGATFTTMLATAGVMVDRSLTGARRDSILGCIYLVGAAGALVVGTRIVQELQDIETVLFGSAVAVLPEQFRLLGLLAAGLLGLHLWWARGFIAASFDGEGARIRGLPVKVLDGVLLGSLALAISVCTRVLGALPVFALSVLPALSAVAAAVNVRHALVVAALLGSVSGFGGYVMAFCFKLPVGASQVLVAAGWVAVVYGGRVLVAWGGAAKSKA